MDHHAFTQKAQEFLTYLEQEKNVSNHTLRAYRSDLHQFVMFWGRIAKQDPAEAVTPDRIAKRYILSLFYQNIAKTTLARKVSCLRSLAAFLKKQGITLDIKIKTPRLEKKLPVTLSIDEMLYLLDQVKATDLPSKYPYRDKAVIELLYATGVRCAELTGMRLGHVDMKDKTIRVTGKGRKERIVLFGSKAKESLEHYIHHERASFGLDANDYLFLVRAEAASLNERCSAFVRCIAGCSKLIANLLRTKFVTHLRRTFLIKGLIYALFKNCLAINRFQRPKCIPMFPQRSLLVCAMISIL